MNASDNISYVRRVMLEFSDDSGLSNPARPPRRYLWTDAHAVCNFLSLFTATGQDEYRDLAARLIDQVHVVLGRHRDDDTRHGWISGLDDNEGRRHPTAGGLRIGKRLPERPPGEAYDERLEWERDGQYFHYLTKWMHALYRASRVTGDVRYCRWAVELAKAAHAGFARALEPGRPKQLVWKMSIDLSRALLASKGQHDPLDGLVTYSELALCADTGARGETGPVLATEIRETEAMIGDPHWASSDPLGIGGLLFDTCRVFELYDAGRYETATLVPILVRDILGSLHAFSGYGSANDPAENRLAFRELGFCIGLKGVERLRSIAAAHPEILHGVPVEALEILQAFVSQGKAIESFWREPGNQRVRSWRDHSDINTVMLATSLLPDEFLAL